MRAVFRHRRLGGLTHRHTAAKSVCVCIYINASRLWRREKKMNACKKKKNAHTRAKRVGVNLRRADAAKTGPPCRSSVDPARRPGGFDGWTLGGSDRAAVAAVVSGAAAC